MAADEPEHRHRPRNGTWTARELELAFADQQRQLADVRNAMDALAAVPMEVGKLAVRLEADVDKLEGFEGWLHDVETRLGRRIDSVGERVDGCESKIDKSVQAVADRVDTELSTRRKNRVTVAVAVIAASGTVLAALIAAVVAIVNAGGV